MHKRTIETLCFIAALAVGAGCPAGGDSKDGKDAKKDGKAKVAAKEDKKGDKKADKKADSKADKKADAKADAKADDGGKVDEPAPTPATPDEIAKFYQACWAAFGKDWDAFGKCYAEDAVAVDSMGEYNGRDAIVASAKDMSAAFTESVGELQLTLVNGNNVVGIARVGGKNTAPMKMGGAEIPATNKSYGLFMGHVVQLDDAGRQVVKEWTFFDSGTMMAQLGLSKSKQRPVADQDWDNKATVIAKNDDAEKKNVEAHNAFVTAFNAHDVKAIGDAMADDAKWSEQASPSDMDKKKFLKDLPAMFKAFSDVKITDDNVWAAGDYVVSTGKWEGTNDGDMKAMKLKKTGKQVSLPFVEVTQYKDGKIAANWIFYDGMQFAIQLGLVPAPGGAPAEGEKKEEAKGEEAKAEEKKEEPKADEKKPEEKKAEEKKGG